MKAILKGLLAVSFLAGIAVAASGPAENDFKALFAKHWQISKEFYSGGGRSHARRKLRFQTEFGRDELR